ARCGEAVRGGLSFGADANSVQLVQQPSEVRSVVADGAANWRRADCDRTLRAERVQREDWALGAEAAGRPGEGPDVLFVWANAGAVEPDDVSAGRDAEAGGARRGSKPGAEVV